MRLSLSSFLLFPLLQGCLSYVIPRSDGHSQPSIDQLSPEPRTVVPEAKLSLSEGRKLRSRVAENSFWDWTHDEAVGEPMQDKDIDIVIASVEHARMLALAGLQVQRDNALYTTIFGDPAGEVYDEVMQNLRRVVNILDTATPTQLGQITDDDRVEGIIDFFRAPLAGTFGNGPFVTAQSWREVITMRPEFFDRTDFFSPSVPAWADPLALSNPEYFELALLRTRGATLLHELIHRVSRGRMQPILDRAISQGAEVHIDFGGAPVRVVDLPMNAIRPPPSDTNAIARDGAVTFGIEATEEAYTVNNIARMSLTTYGRFMAALNAQHYSAFAFAAFTNTPVTTFIPSGIQEAVASRGGPTQQVSVWTAQVSENNSALAATIREDENRALLKILLGVEKTMPTWFIDTHHVEL